jgi:hypothetical protein
MIGVALAEWLCEGEHASASGTSDRDAGPKGDAAASAASLSQHLPDGLGDTIGGKSKEFE